MNRNAIIIFCITLFLFLGCKDKRPILIGYSANLTGRQSELGVTGRNGIEIAVDEINASGGINGHSIKLIVKDDKNNAEEALKVDKEIINEGGIAIIGHLLSGMVKNTIPYSNSEKVLYISPTISTNSLTGFNDYFIRIIASNRIQGELLADEVINKQKLKTVAALYEEHNVAYTGELFDYFKKRYEASGGKIVFTHSFKSGKETDFYDIVEEFIKVKPEAVLSIASGMDNAILCQNLNKFNYNSPVFASLWSMTDDFIIRGGKAVERMHISGVFNIKSGKTEFVKFKAKYLERYNSLPTFSSIYSYEAATVLFEAMKSSKNFSAEELKKSIIKLKNFNGLQDSFSIDKFGDTDRPYQIMIVKNKTFSPKY